MVADGGGNLLWHMDFDAAGDIGAAGIVLAF
jgi:hypothetical protein